MRFAWLLGLLVFTAPEGTAVGIMTDQLETVTRATSDAPVGTQTKLRFTSGHETFVREPLDKVLDDIAGVGAK